MLKIENNKNCNIKINDKTISNLSAKEMFEKLGYEEREETYCLNCVKSYINYKTLNIIYFDSDKTIDVQNMIISYELLQAINKQVEELGWNK